MKLEIRDGHVVSRVTRPLRWPEAGDLSAKLGREGILVLIEAGPVVHLTALAPTTTWQEVRALALVAERTDARLAWHEAVAG